MSNQIVRALEDAAHRVVSALGTAVSEAEQKLLHATADNLESAARRHLEHDAHAAGELERAAARDARDVHVRDGAAPRTAPARTGAPSAGAPTSRAGSSGAGAPGGSLQRELEGASDLPTPHEKLSSQDYPYLRRPSTELEREAIPGDRPDIDPHLTSDPGDRPVPDAGKLRTFNGPVDPYTLQPGTTYYRTVGDGARPDGEFWSAAPPNGESELRSGYAVLNEWNGDHGVVAFTPSEPVLGWEGQVAPQLATGSVEHYLPGGARQIFIPRGTLDGAPGPWVIAPMPERTQP